MNKVNTVDKGAAHTPGPWTIDHEFIHGAPGINGADTVAKVFEIYAEQTGEVIQANARLIAAAPELLAALKELVDGAARMDARLLALTGSPFECERGDITRARAALAKVQS